MNTDVVINFLFGCAFVLCIVCLLVQVATIPPVTQAEYMDAVDGKPQGDIGAMMFSPDYEKSGDVRW